jgi:CO/xanthine dehydrogenase FAD-binding subunit
MPILHDFNYYKPKSLAEAIRLLSGHRGAAILAGGTDIINEIREEVAKPSALIDIKGLSSLKNIIFKDGRLTIGSLVTYSGIIESNVIKKRLPIFIEVAKTVGSLGIRNRATMVGNICSAVPCMDSGPILSVFDATVIVQSTKGKRRIPIHEWFYGPRETARKKNELVTAVEIPIPRTKHAGCYAKLGRYSGEDLAQASVLVIALADRGYRVAFGSVGPVPIRAHEIEKLLNGKVPNEILIAQAQKLIPKIVAPISDIRATKEYRLHMCQVMFERALVTAFDRLNGSGPEYGINVAELIGGVYEN